MLAEVEGQVPSVVLDVKAPDGTDAVAVSVSLDGKPLAARLDGKPLELDPGEHLLRCELDGAKPVEQHVVIHVGERARRLALRFEPIDAPKGPDAAPARPILAAVGVGAGFEGHGLSLRGGLAAAGCDPRCAPDQVNAVTRSFLIGDVTVGAGLASLVAATIVFLVRPAAPPPTAALVPLDHGAALRAGGVF
jgi:hypothetical protein